MKYQRVLHNVQKKEEQDILETSKLAPNFADVFSYTIGEGKGQVIIPQNNNMQEINQLVHDTMDNINDVAIFDPIMDKVRQDNKIRQFIDILFKKEKKVGTQDLYKDTINFDDILRDIGMDPDNYQIKSKFLDIFNEVKHFETLANSVTPTFKEVFYASKNAPFSDKVPNFGTVMRKLKTQSNIKR